MALDICQYKGLKELNLCAINARFRLLFEEVCILKTTGGGGGTGLGMKSITSADFQPNGITYLDPLVSATSRVFLNDINRFIYIKYNEWRIVPGGLQILLPSFDANTINYDIEIFY